MQVPFGSLAGLGIVFRRQFHHGLVWIGSWRPRISCLSCDARRCRDSRHNIDLEGQLDLEANRRSFGPAKTNIESAIA